MQRSRKRTYTSLALPQDYSLNLDCAHLFEYDAGLYKLLVLYPQEIIPIFDVEINKYFAEQLLADDEDTFPQIQARDVLRVCVGQPALMR